MRWLGLLAALLILWVIILVSAWRPVSGLVVDREFEVVKGQGLREIAGRLEEDGVIRSTQSFVLFAAITGQGSQLKPGLYVISAGSSTPQIVYQLKVGARREVEVVIPEGASFYLVDKILAEKNIISAGELIKHVQLSSAMLQGRLFPDTYFFYLDSDPRAVLDKMTANFELKVRSLLLSRVMSAKQVQDVLIIASLLEKEVPEYEDRRVVAGLLLKRRKEGMPLQVDATICYAKQAKANQYVDCYPFQNGDFKIDSEYNTYLNRGLPPQAIGSPGLSAIKAALDPKASPYWYYLSDPKTGKTIFSRTFDEHVANKAKYLK